MEPLNFYDLFEKIKKVSGCRTQKELADKLSISPQAVTSAKTKNKIPKTWFDIVYEKFGVTESELCQQIENEIAKKDFHALGFLPQQNHGVEKIIHQMQPEKDGFDQIMDEFFFLVKEWQIEENGRSTRTAIDFIQEFPKRFDEMAEWQKKRKGESILDRIPEIKPISGKGN